jgi:4'-phosphopantetheinyl transferase
LVEQLTHGSPLCELKQGEIHVWNADLDGYRATASFSHILAPEEQIRADALPTDRDRRRYIAGRAILRQLLARYLAKLPYALVFRYNQHGKPRLADRALHFNVTHSNGKALYALSATQEVGIDVERVATGLEPQPGGCLSCSRPDEYFREWTRREAYAKARGEGIGFELCSGFAHLKRAISGMWCFDFAPWPGYIATLAAGYDPGRVRRIPWQSCRDSRADYYEVENDHFLVGSFADSPRC